MALRPRYVVPLLAGALLVVPAGRPAEAGLLDPLLGRAVGVVSTALDTTTGLLTGASWGYAPSQTPMSLVASTVGADRMWSPGYTATGVVVAGGNKGAIQPYLDNPARDPYVIAVGAADPRGTASSLDDTVPDSSSRGSSSRRVDLVAPGQSIVSLRDPGSYVDTSYPGSRVETRTWGSVSWTQASWGGVSWSSRSWSDQQCSSRSWSGSGWTARSWSARSWSASSWA